jgi:hypothetical protein
LAGNFHPFDPAVADDLVARWQNDNRRKTPISSRDLIARITADAVAEPTEDDYARLGLQPYQILKRKAFIRHFRSAKTYVWKRALMVSIPMRVEQIMDGVNGMLMATGGSLAKSGKQTKSDIALYDEIVDNFNEEGFLSVTIHLTQRILGNVEKQPNSLVVSVSYANYLEQQYQLCQDYLLHNSAG